MCRAMQENGVFDPALCPLLQGLDPAEIALRMQTDPDILACRAALEGEPGRYRDPQSDDRSAPGPQA